MAKETEMAFNASEELILHLKDMQEKTTLKRGTEINTLSFSSNEGLLFVNVGTKTYELRDCSKESVLERLGMEGDVLNHLPKEVLAHFMSEAAKVREGKGQVTIVDGKVDAILSDNGTGNDYSSIPASRIFEETQQWIWENTEGLCTFKGAWTHQYVYGKWYTDDNLPSSSQSVQQKLAITLSTSDIGKGSICFRASLYVPKTKYELPLCSEIKIGHRGDTKMLAVVEALNMVQGTVFKGEDFQKLSKINIAYPRNTFLRVCKKLKLPKKACNRALQYGNIYSCKTALDVYLYMGQIPANYAEKSMANEARLQADIYKAVGVNWEEYDIPGDFSY